MVRPLAPALLALTLACSAAPQCKVDGDCASGQYCFQGSCGASHAPGGGGGDVPPGAVTLQGGTVDRLYFAVTGDTRPADVDSFDAAPYDAMAQIAASMKKVGAQFAVDLGDHMYVDADQPQLAEQEMQRYLSAISAFGGAFFMTMGNHECADWVCEPGSADANFQAFMKALAPVSSTPWYTFDIQTSLGGARFVDVADDAWGSAEQSWLDATLARADADFSAGRLTYTIVLRHHPVDGGRTGKQSLVATLLSHHYTLLLTAHEHDYAHLNGGAANGRAVVVGIGGANPRHVGFGMVRQETSGELTFQLYDAYGNPTADPAWSVAPR